MPERPNLYAILGVGRDATIDEIRRAFRRLARSAHPDATAEPTTDGAEFRAVRHAYEVLSDPASRSEYDRSGQATDDRPGQPVEVRKHGAGRPVRNGDTPRRDCPTCGGGGRIATTAGCSACAATGVVVEIDVERARRWPCRTCRGAGAVRRIIACPDCASGDQPR